jgi:hypothetical protein
MKSVKRILRVLANECRNYLVEDAQSKNDKFNGFDSTKNTDERLLELENVVHHLSNQVVSLTSTLNETNEILTTTLTAVEEILRALEEMSDPESYVDEDEEPFGLRAGMVGDYDYESDESEEFVSMLDEMSKTRLN